MAVQNIVDKFSISGWGSDRTKTLLMTAIEGTTITAWFLLLQGNPARPVPSLNSYLITDLLLVAPLLVFGLFIENTVALNQFAEPPKHHGTTAFGLAVTETVIWSLWLAFVTLELFSPRGIGPALVIVAVLFVLQHAVEMQVVTTQLPLPFTPRVISTSVVEATAATTLWIFTTEGEVLLGIIALLILLGVEHEARLVGDTHKWE